MQGVHGQPCNTDRRVQRQFQITSDMITEEEIIKGQLSRINERLKEKHVLKIGKFIDGYLITLDGKKLQFIQTHKEVMDYLEGFLEATKLLTPSPEVTNN